MNKLLAAVRARLIDDVRQAWRWSSVRLHALAALIGGVYDIMPVLSPQIAAMLPGQAQVKAIGVYAIVGLVLRVTKLRHNG